MTPQELIDGAQLVDARANLPTIDAATWADKRARVPGTATCVVDVVNVNTTYEDCKHTINKDINLVRFGIVMPARITNIHARNLKGLGVDIELRNTGPFTFEQQ